MLLREAGGLALLERDDVSLACGTNWTEGRRAASPAPLGARVGRRHEGMKEGLAARGSSGWSGMERSGRMRGAERGEGVGLAERERGDRDMLGKR